MAYMVTQNSTALQALRGRIPVGEYAFPGPLRDQLVAAIMDGRKTTTTGLVVEYEHEGIDPLQLLGGYELVVDSADEPVCVTRTTSVRVVPLHQVDLQHCRDEGEGYDSVAEWEHAHREFWESEEFRADLGAAGVSLDAHTPVVLLRFEVIDPEDVLI
ncbi:ASCH domain-containing protein [Corynebacterium sp. TAE3-ERU30]|nr:ASCH domain-containing protein [Corynebacterium sp. TAE3-ERU30]